MKTHKWTLEEAVATAKLIEPIARQHGAHIGLTGGVLYWEGARKDVDFIVYRHQVPQDDPAYLPEVPVDAFVDALRDVGIYLFKPMHRVYKVTLGDPAERRFIDLIFADRTGDLSDDSKTPDATDDETKPVAGVDDGTQFAPIEETAVG